jgi:peptide/nickel transport system permease protein
MGLGSYIARRLIIVIPTFIFITLLVFALIHMAPGDPIRLMLATRPAPQWLIDQIRTNLGYDKPVYVQYFLWLSRLFQGDLGYSFQSGVHVSTLLQAKIWKTLELMLFARAISIILAVFFGVISAVRHYSTLDNVVSTVSLFGYAMPSFWLALLSILILSLGLGWFPTSGYISPGTEYNIWDHIHHLILPVSVIAVSETAYLFRIVRSSMLEVLNQDYIMTARAKGVSEWMVIYKHALKNALMPVITIIGIQMGFLLSGSVVIEQIFAWPGLGRFTVEVAQARDYTSLMGVTIVLAIMVLIANVITDITYAVIDPRVQYT